ncbi:MAG: aldo/keto reductase [Candidatus Dojkabacteria bacterium]|nr:aldo/keto reductase [Candidatus Dojkabacteria bacterium]
MAKPYGASDIAHTSESLFKEVRVPPHNIFTGVELMIFDNTIIITKDNGFRDYTVITIKNKFFVELLKSMYDFIWERSSTYYGPNNKFPRLKLNGQDISAMGIGTWGVGGYMFKNKYTSEFQEIDALRYSIGQGLNYIDFCLDYSQGESIKTTAKAIKDYPRESLFINGKFTNMHKARNIKDVKELERQVDEYLEILDTHYLDSFMIHSPALAKEMGFEEMFKELDRLVDSGKSNL